MTEEKHPSIIEQARAAGFEADFYDFRKAKVHGTDFFNPAIMRRHDGLWLVTRRSEQLDWFEFGRNALMAFHLDEEHLPLYGKPILIPRFSDREHFEDPRAFIHGDRTWISACNFVIYEGGKTWTGAHQILAELEEDWTVKHRYDPAYGKNGPGVFEQKGGGDEKNWLWFSHAGLLHLVYWTFPHTIVRWDEALRPSEEYITQVWHTGWRHGEPRGGTAPVKVGDEFISFFHSSMPWRPPKRRYYMGAYAFQAEPPFTVTAVTPEPLLAGSLDDPWGEGKPLVVFPCAALHEDREWTISLGVNDLVSARAVIPHHLLMRRLSREVKKIMPPPPTISPVQTVFA